MSDEKSTRRQQMIVRRLNYVARLANNTGTNAVLVDIDPNFQYLPKDDAFVFIVLLPVYLSSPTTGTIAGGKDTTSSVSSYQDAKERVVLPWVKRMQAVDMENAGRIDYDARMVPNAAGVRVKLPAIYVSAAKYNVSGNLSRDATDTIVLKQQLARVRETADRTNVPDLEEVKWVVDRGLHAIKSANTFDKDVADKYVQELRAVEQDNINKTAAIESLASGKESNKYRIVVHLYLYDALYNADDANTFEKLAPYKNIYSMPDAPASLATTRSTFAAFIV